MMKVLATYSSNSNPDKSYKIREGKDGVIYCDCWQWKKYRKCKHLEDYRKQSKEDDLSSAIEKAVETLTS